MPASWPEYNPATGEVLGYFQSPGEGEVTAALERCRQAAALWGERPVRERCRYLRRMRELLAGERDRAVELLTATTGKPPVEAMMGELFPTLELLTYPERHAPRKLGPERRPTPLAFLGSKSYVEYRPLGAVAVLSPWNLPLQLALVPLATALAAGNGVVLKPSDATPSVGDFIAELAARADLPRDLVQVLHGGAQTGARVVDAAPDLVFFTGSWAGGCKVMERAARHPVPVHLELGGKDAMVVFGDAPLERAARGAVYGAFANSGQICVSAERVFVERSVYEPFLEAAREQARDLTTGTGVDAEMGFLTVPQRGAVIADQVREALDQGARLLWGDPGQLERRPGPLILADVTPDMRVMTDETFGPVMAVMPFSGEEEAISLANASPFGLGASLWTGDLQRGRRLASRVASGTCDVNDVFKTVGNPYLPFGGVKNSGFGRYHGPEGVYAFTQSRGIMVNPGRKPREPNWFPFHRPRYEMVSRLIATLHTPLPWARKLVNLARFWLQTRGGG